MELGDRFYEAMRLGIKNKCFSSIYDYTIKGRKLKQKYDIDIRNIICNCRMN